MLVMRAFLAALATSACLAAPAVGVTGVAAGPRDLPPIPAKRLGMLCRADTPAFRLWWNDTIGAAGALAAADGSCATVPAAVEESASTAEASRAAALALGFPALIGDAPPVFVTNPGLTRALLRSPALRRARLLRGYPVATRGSYLAGLPTATRNRVLKGLQRTLRTRLLADVARARPGRPVDFQGGDRRVDLVLDASGVTGMVQGPQAGRTSCSQRSGGATSGSARFSTAAVYVLTPGETAERAVIAHELFHVAQCNMSVPGGAPDLLSEGSAEWFAARAEPAAFAQPPKATADGGLSISGGGSRVVSFCNRFDPAGGPLDPYNSWGVWQALDAGAARPGRLLAALRGAAAPTGMPTTQRLIAGVGAGNWRAAVRTAAQSLCGGLRSPFSDLVFAPELRGFFGAGQPVAVSGSPARLEVPASGGASLVARWGAPAPAGVTIRLTSSQVGADTLAPQAVATGSAGPLAVIVRDGAAVIDIPAASLADQELTVFVANPLPAGVLSVQASVEPGPAT